MKNNTIHTVDFTPRKYVQPKQQKVWLASDTTIKTSDKTIKTSQGI